MRYFLYSSAILNIILILGWVFLWLSLSMKAPKESFTHLGDDSYTFINPILDYDIDLDYQNISRLQKKLSEYFTQLQESQEIESIAYYVQFLKTWQNFWFNENEKFAPASLMKLPVAISLLDTYSIEQIEKIYIDPLVVNQVQISTSRNIGSDIVQEDQLYLISDLMKAMLKDSDNMALQILVNFLSGTDLDDINTSFGIDDEDVDANGNISVKKYAGFFRILYNASYLSRKNSEYILSILSRSSYRDGIRSGIPLEVPIAHKFGERAYTDSNIKQLHDCGIVYKEDNPFILCVMTRGEDFEVLESVIQKTTQIIYSNISWLDWKK